MIYVNKWAVLFLAMVLGMVLTPPLAIAANPTPPTNVCIDSTTCAPDPIPSSTSGGVKWHPGHYVGYNSGGSVRYDNSSLSALYSFISSICSNSNIEGVQIHVLWADLEGATAGDYTSGFTWTDQILSRLKACGKRLMLGINTQTFGGYYASPGPSLSKMQGVYPAYLISSAYGTCCSGSAWGAALAGVQDGSYTGPKTVARVWTQPVTDRLIALSAAYAARYDNHPNFEMISAGETAYSGTNTYPGGFSASSLYSQLKRHMTADSKAWRHTVVRVAVNYGGSDEEMLDFFNHCRSLPNCAIGGPDHEMGLPEISRSIQANRLFRGRDGGTDYRGSVAWVGETQYAGLGIGNYPVDTPKEIHYYNRDVMRSSYQIWVPNETYGTSLQKWSTGILPFIESIGGSIQHTSCPSAFKNGCATR